MGPASTSPEHANQRANCHLCGSKAAFLSEAGALRDQDAVLVAEVSHNVLALGVEDFAGPVEPVRPAVRVEGRLSAEEMRY